MKLDIPLTYPPSCVFFNKSVLFLIAGVQHYIEMKSYSLKRRTKIVFNKVLKGLKICEFELKYRSEYSQSVDVQRLITHEIRHKLPGRTIEANGNVTQLKGRFYFLPHHFLRVT